MKGKLNYLFSVLAFLSCFALVTAQEVIVRAELDTNRALIGDQLRLSLTVVKPANLHIKFPQLKDTITRRIEIVRDSYSDTASVSQDRVSLGRNLLITVFDTGFFEIPALHFIANSGESADTLSTLPLQFTILPVKADTTLKDIKENFRAPVNLAEIAYYVKKNYPFGLLALAVALVTWFVIRTLRKRHGKKKGIRKEVPSEPPGVTALRELEILRTEKPWMHNRVKLYHSRLSEILRSYIEGRFRIMALEQTTDEILAAMKSPVCEAPDLNKLAGILRLSDLVKFAKVVPSPEENALQLDLAVEFVHSTTLNEEENNRETDPEKNAVQHNEIAHA